MDDTLKDMDCIVLVGGKGTRLQSVVSDVPKPMAAINGIPFLRILLDQLNKKGIEKFTLATGYKTEIIQQYFSENNPTYPIAYSKENEPLGTGGAIMQALPKVSSDKVLVINGDTFFDLELHAFVKKATELSQPCVLALKKVFQSDRYGNVELAGDDILQFEEKVFREEALINSGIYLLDRKWFLQFAFEKKFSFEKEFLEIYAKEKRISGIEMEGYFIDIGIPEDYKKAQHDFKRITNR